MGIELARGREKEKEGRKTEREKEREHLVPHGSGTGALTGLGETGG